MCVQVESGWSGEAVYKEEGVMTFQNILSASFWESGAWLDDFPQHLSDTQVVLLSRPWSLLSGSGSVTETERV